MRAAYVRATFGIAGILLSGCQLSAGTDPFAGTAQSLTAPGSGLRFERSFFPAPWLERVRLYSRPETQKPPTVKVMALSPGGGVLAWGDDDGNVFLAEVTGNTCVVVKGTSVRRGPTWDPADPPPGVIAIRFADDATLHWMGDMGAVWRARIRGTRVKQKKRIFNDGTGFSGAFTRRAFVQTRPRRDRWFSHEYVLEKYSLSTGKLEAMCRIYPMRKGLYHYVEAMSLSRSGELLGICSEGNAGIVRMKDFRLVSTLGVETGKAIAFSPDGSLVAVGTIRSEVVVCDTSSGKVIRRITLPDAHIAYALAFRSNDILWFSKGTPVDSLNVKTGKTREVLRNEDAMSFLFDGRRLFVGSYRGHVRVYALEAPATRESPGPERNRPALKSTATSSPTSRPVVPK